MAPKLPLKKITVTDDNFFSPAGGGGTKTVFGDVTPEVRRTVASEVEAVGYHFTKSFRANPRAAAVARVVLKREALAKSHRPTHLFESGGCPIVGIGALGELLVSVRSTTIPRLAGAIEADRSKVGEANISTIKSVAPFALPDEPLAALKIELASTHGLAREAPSLSAQCR